MTATTESKELESKLRELVGSDLEYSAEYQVGHERTKKPDRELVWKIKLKNGNVRLETEYFQGCAHLPGYNWQTSQTVAGDEAIARALHAGRKLCGNGCEVALGATGLLSAPPLSEVMYSLVLDAEAIDHASFEEWASAFGYDTDSRKAEATYRACLEFAIKLRAMFGNEVVNQIRELLSDM